MGFIVSPLREWRKKGRNALILQWLAGTEYNIDTDDKSNNIITVHPIWGQQNPLNVDLLWRCFEKKVNQHLGFAIINWNNPKK